MRLNEPTNRANTNIVNTLLGDEPNKGGFKSSLDYKAESKDVLTAAKDGKKKKNQQRQSDHEQQQQQQKNYSKSSFPTRARDSTGIPPRRYDISDLGKMDEYDLMNALREDPEFAEAVQQYSTQLEEKERADKAAAEERKDRRSKPSSPPVAERRKARLAKSSSSSSEPTSSPSRSPSLEEHPDHVRELVGRDVPVTQWIVLLVLVGAGLYFLMGTELKDAFAYIVKYTGKAKRRTQKIRGSKNKLRSRHNNKGKKKADTSRKSFTTKKTPTPISEPKEPVNPVTPAPAPQQETPKEPSPKATVAKKSKKKKKQKQQPKVEEKDSLGLISTDGSAHAEETPTVSSPIKSLSPPLINTESDDTGVGEWEIVTRSRKPVAKSAVAAAEVSVTTKEESETPLDTTPETSTAETETPKQPVDTQQDKEVSLITTTQDQTVDNGWETATKSRKSSASKVSSPKEVSKEQKTSPAKSESKPAAETVKVEDKKKQATNGSDNKNSKKSSQNKKKKAAQPAKTAKCNDTVGDAALALKLQLEEENLVHQEGNEQPEEQWEEVKKNKSKKG